MNLHAQRLTLLPPLKTVDFAYGGLFSFKTRWNISFRIRDILLILRSIGKHLDLVEL